MLFVRVYGELSCMTMMDLTGQLYTYAWHAQLHCEKYIEFLSLDQPANVFLPGLRSLNSGYRSATIVFMTSVGIYHCACVNRYSL